MFTAKKNIALILTALLLASQMQVLVAMAALNGYAIGNDGIAGQSTYLKAKGFASAEPINFVVQKPDGVNLTISAQTDNDGQAQVELYDYHTKKAGEYGLYAYSQDQTEKTAATTFRILTAPLDENISTVSVDRAMVRANGTDSAKIDVYLKDAYENPIKGHNVKLISTRQADQITANSSWTDEDGKISFDVKSSTAGMSSFMALDLGEDKMLSQRANVSFVDESSLVGDIGGDLINVANAADFGTLSGFEITDLPDTIKPNENISFGVKAVDTDGKTVQDYTGTIRFSAEGDNSSGVTLPANYKFMPEDLGVHAFNLGLSFAEAGTYNIVVNDVSDKFKQGNKTVVVGGGATTTGGGESKPTITAPAAGTYSQAEQTVSGSAKPGSTIKIYDNDNEVGSSPVGPTGKYSFQTKALTDGDHSIYVVSVDPISLEVNGTSDTVKISIDTTPPALDDLQLDPSTGIKAGSVINVKVYSEKNLSQAAVILNYDIIALNASIDDPTIYVGTIQAPADPGVYKLNVLLVDEMQNEKTYEDQATITVDPKGGTIETATKPATPATTPPATTPPATTPTGETVPVAGAPSQVTGLIAYGSDKRVTLVWDAATDDKMVKNYKVYYGEDVKDLSKIVMTKDASTTWYIPNLDNGKEYFFAVSAIDDQGNESSSKSEIVSGIPFMLEIKNALSTAPTQPLQQPVALRPAAYNGPFPTKTASTGPEVFFLLGISAVTGVFASRKRK